MIELKTRTKRWGHSIGILIPKQFGIKEDEELRIHIEPANRFTKVKDIFGMLRLKKPTGKALKEIDRELDIGA